MRERINLSAIARDLLSRGVFTTKSLGLAIGLSQASVSRLCTGKTESINSDSAFRLVELAGGRIEPPQLAESGQSSKSLAHEAG